MRSQAPPLARLSAALRPGGIGICQLIEAISFFFADYPANRPAVTREADAPALLSGLQHLRRVLSSLGYGDRKTFHAGEWCKRNAEESTR